MKTNRILMLTAMAAMAIVMVSCTPDEPVVPVMDGDVIIAEQNGLQLEGTVWRAIDEYDIHVHTMSYHFKEEITYTFSTSDSGVQHLREVIIAGYPVAEDDEDCNFYHEFQYNVIDNIVFTEYSNGVQEPLYYNPANNTLTVDVYLDNVLDRRVVFHQVEPERE